MRSACTGDNVAARHKGAKHLNQKKPKRSAPGKIEDVFQRLNLSAADRGQGPIITQFFDPMALHTQSVEYRTILTNGTGRTLGLRDAELE